MRAYGSAEGRFAPFYSPRAEAAIRLVLCENSLRPGCGFYLIARLKSLRKKVRGRVEAELFPKRSRTVLSRERGIDLC